MQLRERRVVAALIVCALSWSVGASAAEISVGPEVMVAGAKHREKGSRASGVAAAPLIVVDARGGRVELLVEAIIFSPTATISSSSYGLQSVKLNYLNGVLRYWWSPHFALGMGQTVWNQRTQTNFSQGFTAFDSSRGAGTQFEILTQTAIGDDLVRLRLAVDPRVHARESVTEDPFLPPPTVSEQSSEVDGSVSWLHAVKRNTRLEAGVRYLHLISGYDNGRFADSNTIVGPFANMLFRL